jgi:UPF0042 nucleotide-binding protein
MKASLATDASAAGAGRPAAAKSRVVLVTGMSGAGKSSALKALEDIGYEAVDNLPLALLGGLVQTEGELPRPLAIGVDIRTRDFGVDSFVERLGSLRANPRIDVRLLFVDCDDGSCGGASPRRGGAIPWRSTVPSPTGSNASGR